MQPAVLYGPLRDRETFEQVYHDHRAAIYRFALSRLGECQLAEDAVQEIFLRIWIGMSSYDRSREPGPWIYRIAHNYCVDELRRSRIRPVLVCSDKANAVREGNGSAEAAEDEVLRSDQQRIVREALQQLPPAQRRAIMLVFYCGLSSMEIAARFEQPLGTVKTRVRQGMIKLRYRLHDQIGDSCE